MKERPIIFSGEMVRALLDGRKFQTRRIVKPQPPLNFKDPRLAWGGTSKIPDCPYGLPGDRLWVRETWLGHPGLGPGILYKADSVLPEWEGCLKPWKPSIHMPRWASRTTLEITDVRVQRLQEITEEDAEAEGVQQTGTYVTAWSRLGFKLAFERLWNSIHGPNAWGLNPWVWAISFRRLP